MNIRSAFIDPLYGGVETVPIVRGYAEAVAGFSFSVRVASVVAIVVVFWAHFVGSGERTLTHTSHGPSLITRPRTRMTGLPKPKIGY